LPVGRDLRQDGAKVISMGWHDFRMPLSLAPTRPGLPGLRRTRPDADFAEIRL